MSEATKMCRGHFHAPGTLVPLSEFSIHKGKWQTGKPFAQCKACTNWRRTHPKGRDDWNTYVDVPVDVVEELRRRIGPVEAARRAGLHVDALMPSRLAKHTMRVSTVDKLRSVLVQARENGEDDYDPSVARMASLIPGGPPGAREKAVRAMQEMWQRRKVELEKKAHEISVHRLERYLAEKTPVDNTPPDKNWWHNTGQEWLPKWGEEMLGSDF